MDTIQDARRVLSATEASLRQLIEQGLKEQRYSEIVEIAKLADGVARLLHTPQAAFASPPEITANATSLPSPISRASSAKRIPTKRDYPRFERDGDRLVKIGWSKRRKGLYEHRASRQAVVAFA